MSVPLENVVELEEEDEVEVEGEGLRVGEVFEVEVTLGCKAEVISVSLGLLVGGIVRGVGTLLFNFEFIVMDFVFLGVVFLSIVFEMQI
jgi:hypothetical protein